MQPQNVTDDHRYIPFVIVTITSSFTLSRLYHRIFNMSNTDMVATCGTGKSVRSMHIIMFNHGFLVGFVLLYL